MCDPMTAMIGLQLAGTAVSAFGQMAQGNTAADMGRLQRAAYDDQARNVERAGAFEAMQERRKQELVAANARAQVGASGVAMEGSPTEVLLANARQDELDLQAIQFGSAVKSGQLRTQGAISEFSGGRAQTAGYIAGASTLLTGTANAFMPKNSVKLGQGGMQNFGLSATRPGGLY